MVSMEALTLQVCEQVDFATLCKQHKENIRGHQVQESPMMKQQDKTIQEDSWFMKQQQNISCHECTAGGSGLCACLCGEAMLWLSGKELQMERLESLLFWIPLRTLVFSHHVHLISKTRHEGAAVSWSAMLDWSWQITLPFWWVPHKCILRCIN